MKLFASGRKKHLEGSGRFGKACGKIQGTPAQKAVAIVSLKQIHMIGTWQNKVLLFVYHFFTEDSISWMYGRFHFFIVRNIPLLYYCTEYGIFRYHVKAWTRFDKRWRLGAAYKRRIHFHVT